MPYLISSASFSRKLGLYSKNYEHTQTFLEKGVQDYNIDGFITFPGRRLVKAIGKEEYRVIVEDSVGFYTAYAVKLKHHDDITFPVPAVTQVMVWRSPSLLHQSAVAGFPQLFFKHILMNNNIVVSDSEQTSDGQRFWLTMLDWAYYNRYYLYVADGTEGIDWPKYPIRGMNELEEKWLNYAWGHDKDTHTHRRLIISLNEIKG